jgi:hypothetical protein
MSSPFLTLVAILSGMLTFSLLSLFALFALFLRGDSQESPTPTRYTTMIDQRTQELDQWCDRVLQELAQSLDKSPSNGVQFNHIDIFQWGRERIPPYFRDSYYSGSIPLLHGYDPVAEEDPLAVN